MVTGNQRLIDKVDKNKKKLEEEKEEKS